MKIGAHTIAKGGAAGSQKRRYPAAARHLRCLDRVDRRPLARLIVTYSFQRLGFLLLQIQRRMLVDEDLRDAR